MVGKTQVFRQKHRTPEADLDLADIHRCLESHGFYILNLGQELEKWIYFIQLREKNKCDDGLSRLLIFLNPNCVLREGGDELNFKTLHKSSQVVQISGLSMLTSIQNMGTELKTL